MERCEQTARSFQQGQNHGPHVHDVPAGDGECTDGPQAAAFRQLEGVEPPGIGAMNPGAPAAPAVLRKTPLLSLAMLSGPFHKCIHVSAARHSGRPEPAVALPDISIVPPESPHYLSVVSPSHLCKVCRGATVRLRRGNGGLRVKLRGRTWEWAVGGWRQVVVFSAHLPGRVTARTE